MNESTGWGFAGVLLGGFLNGTFVLPMKRMPEWRWENTWLVYSVVGLIIVPWVTAIAVVPQLGHIFHQTSWSTLTKVLIFGFGWGVGSVLFGLGVNRLGLAVGYGIILGLTSAIGALLPLLVVHPDRLWTPQGEALCTGTLLVIVGIVFCAVAGSRRDKDAKGLARIVPGGFAAGLVICILAGILSPMLNFAFVFGETLQRQAISLGSRASMASNAIWSLAVTAGFIANSGYCVHLLRKNRSWCYFSAAANPARYWLGGSLMGILCFGSFIAYGMGATALGRLGGIVGWPLFLSMSIITSNLWGALTGEWRGASYRSYAYFLAGVGFLLVAITVIARGGI